MRTDTNPPDGSWAAPNCSARQRRFYSHTFAHGARDSCALASRTKVLVEARADCVLW